MSGKVSVPCPDHRQLSFWEKSPFRVSSNPNQTVPAHPKTQTAEANTAWRSYLTLFSLSNHQLRIECRQRLSHSPVSLMETEPAAFGLSLSTAGSSHTNSRGPSGYFLEKPPLQLPEAIMPTSEVELPVGSSTKVASWQ